MALTVFSNSTTAYAEEVSANFIHVGGGDMLPLANSGTMGDTTLTYDLGSSNYKWNNVYIRDVGDLPVIRKISETIVLSATSSIEISGLNGDSDCQYDLLFIVPRVSITTKYSLIINGSSDSSNYGSSQVRAYSPRFNITDSSYYDEQFAATSTGIVFYSNSGLQSATSVCMLYLRMRLTTKTGGYRNLYCCGGMLDTQASTWHMNSGGGNVFSTSITITSLKIYDTGSNLPTNTVLTVWSKNAI